MNRLPAGIVSLLMALILWTGLALAAPVVSEIRIEGNERVDPTSIERALSLKVGVPYSESLATQSVRDLYRMSVFSRVSIEDEPLPEGGVLLLVRVEEFPMVRRIVLSGNKNIAEEELKKALKIKAFSFADPGKLKAEIQALEDVYRTAGYHGTTIESRVESSDRGVVITYTIRESSKTLIHEVDIVGNRHLDDHAIHKVMRTREIGPMAFLSDAGGYDPKAVEEDRQRVQLLYMESGYIDVQVRDPETKIHPDGRGLYVSLEVEEGPQYTLGTVRYEGDWSGLPDFVRRQPDVKIGDIFVRSKVLQDLNMYEASYRDQGYAWCRVEPLFDKDPVSGKVDLKLILTKGPLVHVRWIHVSGNVKTRDYVIRREVRLLEGDLFSQKKLDDTARFIRALGFFSSLEVRPVKVGEDQADIHIKVEDGSAGSLSAGAAFSSQTGIVGTVQLSLGNFAGRGQRFNLNAEVGGEESTYSLSFTEPRLFSGVFSLGLDVFDKSNEYSQYTQDSRGGSVRLGYRLSDFSSVSVRYRYVTYDVYDIDLDASLIIREQEGRSTTSSLRFGYTYDTRDYPMDPRHGVNHRLYADLAGGVLGGDNEFIRYQAEGSFFKPLLGDLIGLAHFEAGVIAALGGKDIPVTERFFMGGLYSLRGFEYRKVGPLQNGEPVGGTRSFLMNLEATYPMIKESNIKGVLFLDGGNVWAEDEKVSTGDLRYAAGFGFRWAAPIGLLRLEWGVNLDPRPDEVQPGWEFSIGALF